MRKIWHYKRFWFLIGLALVLGLTGFWSYHHVQQQKLTGAYHFSNTPTIFVHGYHGSMNSEVDMMADIQKRGVGHHVLTVTVDRRGRLHFSGTLKAKDSNPLIGVVFKHNTAGEVAYANWLDKVMRALKNRYHVTQFNAVGHSMGAVAWVLYALKDHDAAKWPRMNKLVTIAGPFDGILGWGDVPNRNYFVNAQGEPKYQTQLFQQMKTDAAQFPSQVPVLNIYGNLKDDSHSDGVVSMVSARSLRYLIKPYAKSYAETQMKGPRAQHSKLHQHNQRVDQALIDFLWAKSDQ